jgi:hypothetical protein
MAVCLLLTGMAFLIPTEGLDDYRRVGVVAASTYLYMAFYGSGEGVRGSYLTPTCSRLTYQPSLCLSLS